MLSSTWRLFGARLGVLSLVLGLVASSAGAGNAKAWNRQLQQTVAGLRAGDWKAAKQGAQRGLDDLARSLAPGKGAGSAVGMFLMCRALAEAGLGEQREAIWDWQIAQQLDPRLESWKLAEFGAAGAFLDRERLSNRPRPSLPTAGTAADQEIAPPQRLAGEPPRVPEAAFTQVRNAQLEFSLLLSAEGLPSYPRIVERGPLETLTLAVSDMLRSSRWEPARRGGQPVAVDYRFKFKFAMTR